MKKAFAILTLAGALFCSSCDDPYEIPWLSLYPLYQSDDILVDRLAGTWYSTGDESERIVFTVYGNSYYIADENLKDGEWIETLHAGAFLLRLGDTFFLDFSASPELSVRGHLFLKIQFDRDELQISALDDGWLRQQVAEQSALSYLDIPGGAMVIAAPTRELRSFLLKHAHDPDAFDSSVTARLHRRSQ
jgi:hypothetical protein